MEWKVDCGGDKELERFLAEQDARLSAVDPVQEWRDRFAPAEQPPLPIKALEVNFFSPAERARDRVVGDGPNRCSIERALELVPAEHLEALLAHEDFRIFYVPRQIPLLQADSVRRRACIEHFGGMCRGKQITVADDSGHVALVLLHELAHALDNKSNGQLAERFGPRLRKNFENFAVEVASHYRTDDEMFAEAYAMAFAPPGRRFFGLSRERSRELKGLLAGVLTDIKHVRV